MAFDKYKIVDNVATDYEMENLRVKGEVVCDDMVMVDRPMFFAGRNAGNVTTDIIVDFNDVQIDTHNAYSGGVWVCPKDGVYSVDLNALLYLAEGIVYVYLYLNSNRVQSLKGVDTGTDGHMSVSTSRKFTLKEGDIVYSGLIGADDNEYLYGGDITYTNLSISYLGA